MIESLKDILTQTGEGLLRWRGRAGGEWHGAQLKTEADRAAHQTLSVALTGLLNIPVISEEDPASHVASRPEQYWLIDPIDGTASLAGGFSGFVTQAALMDKGRPVMAAVYAPALDRLYTAVKGSGAFYNGEKIHVSGADDRLILVDNYPQPKGTAVHMMQELRCTGYLESGSISLKICRVADGSADVFFKDIVVRDWDIGAPLLIVQEAGGTIAQTDGTPYRFDGPMEKSGIIAARTSEICLQVAGALRKIPLS